MKKIVLITLAIGLVVTFAGSGVFVMAQATKQAAAAQVAAAQAVSPQVSKIKELEAAARAMLKGREWVVTLSPSNEKDTFTFTDMTVKSQNLSAKGYNESNYGLTIQPDGSATWETMQTNKDKDIVFLRGDLKGSVMTGIVSTQPKKAARAIYSFTTAVAQPKVETTYAVEQPVKKAKK